MSSKKHNLAQVPQLGAKDRDEKSRGQFEAKFGEHTPCGMGEKFCTEMSRHFSSDRASQLRNLGLDALKPKDIFFSRQSRDEKMPIPTNASCPHPVSWHLLCKKEVRGVRFESDEAMRKLRKPTLKNNFASFQAKEV